MNEQQRMVWEFHTMFGLHVGAVPAVPSPETQDLRVALIQEELDELKYAMWDGDLTATADALGDLAYVVYGAALACGIDLEPIFAEIHRTNREKVGGHRREDGKWLKPDGWQPPNLAAILETQGALKP